MYIYSYVNKEHETIYNIVIIVGTQVVYKKITKELFEAMSKMGYQLFKK